MTRSVFGAQFAADECGGPRIPKLAAQSDFDMERTIAVWTSS